MIEYKTGDRVRLRAGGGYFWNRGFRPEHVYGKVAGKKERNAHAPCISVWLYLRATGKRVSLSPARKHWLFFPEELEKEDI